MTGPLAIRVMVHDAWDDIALEVPAETSVAEVKRRALAASRAGRPEEAYEVKFRGALVRDESASLSALGVVSRSQLIVLSRRRQPVR